MAGVDTGVAGLKPVWIDCDPGETTWYEAWQAASCTVMSGRVADTMALLQPGHDDAMALILAGEGQVQLEMIT